MIHIIGERYKETLEPALLALGVSALWMPDNPELDRRLAGHADLSVCMPNDQTIVAAEEIFPLLVNKLTNKGNTILPCSRQKAVYPMDAGLCICRVGRYDVYNRRTIDPVVADHLTGIPIHVSQGYTRCSICVVSDEAVITADDGIYHKLSGTDLDVLRIRPGSIQLDGYSYGFIGGASFQIDRETLAFTGALDQHPDKSAILTFLMKHSVKPVFLTNGPLFDVGGAVILP